MQAKKNNQMTIKMSPKQPIRVLQEPPLPLLKRKEEPIEGMLATSQINDHRIAVQKEHFTDKWRNPLRRYTGKKERQEIRSAKEEKGKEEIEGYASDKSQTKRYETIEEVAGRPMDEILLENQQLKNRRGDMNTHIQQLNHTIEEAKRILFQLVDAEIQQNPSIALPVACEYELNNRHKREDKPVHAVAECLRKMRYYTPPSATDWEIAKEKMERLERQAKEWKEEKEQYRKEREKMKEQVELLKRKELSVQLEESEVDETAVPVSVQEAENVIARQREREGAVYKEGEVAASGYSEADALTFDFTDEEGVPEGAIDEGEKDFDYLLEEEQEESVEQEEKRVLDELAKPKYLMLLDRRGYTYQPSKNPRFDVVIQKETGVTVPLVYIDHIIQKMDVFDDIMEKTNQIYFLFDNQESMKKGNMKFTSWLLKEKKKNPEKRSIQFSFTTVDELKARGLDELNTM